VESGAEKLGFIKEHQSSEGDGDKSEGAVVAAAVRTDTILSIEIIALTLSTVVSEPIDTQLWVLAIVGLFATVAVYGIVGLIIKMDDIGFHLRDRHQKNKLLQFIARMLIQGMPKVMKIIGVVGVVAMLMVGGGILVHNIESLHGLTHLGQGLPSILPKMIEVFITPIAVALIAGSAILILLRSFSKKSKPF
jgi:predicted DNA repair protein MutK